MKHFCISRTLAQFYMLVPEHYTFYITKRGRVFLEMLREARSFRKFSAFHLTARFITVFHYRRPAPHAAYGINNINHFLESKTKSIIQMHNLTLSQRCWWRIKVWGMTSCRFAIRYCRLGEHTTSILSVGEEEKVVWRQQLHYVWKERIV